MPIVTKTLGEGTQAVFLTVAILECLAGAKQPISVSTLATAIGTSKSRVFRHLRTLLACNYVSQHEAGGDYAIGVRLLELCRSTSDQHDLGRIAAPFMGQLCEQLQHSVIVSRIEPDGVRVVRSVSGRASIVLEVRPESLLPFDRSAQGKVALAFMDGPVPGDTASAVAVAHARLSSGELSAIRQRGVATAQMREGLMGMAVPIFDASGRAAGTLALLNTVAEMQKQDGEVALRKAALAVSRQLGFQPPPEAITTPPAGTARRRPGTRARVPS
jgi:DNA-binding IclR family transcriptional regulator